MAVTLSLCLILNSGFLDLAGYVYAATTESAPVLETEDTITENTDTEKSSADISNTNIDDTTDDTENGEDSNSDETPNAGNDSSNNADNDAGNDSGNNIEGDAGNDSGNNADGNAGNDSGNNVEGDAGNDSGNNVEGDAGNDSGDTGNDDAGSEGGNSTENTTETTTEEITLEETTTTEEEATEEVTTEEEMTTEELMLEALPMVLTLDDTTTTNATIPDNYTDYVAYVDSLKGTSDENTLFINYLQDLINLQTLSAYTDFAGMTIILSSRKDEGYVNASYDTAGSSFVGIGTSEYPFKGTFKGAYAAGTNSATLKLSAPLFQYLATGADISELDIEANGCCSPIAANISGSVELTNIYITGTIGTGGSSEGVAGTLAATMWPDADVTVSGVASTANVAAPTAGGLVGIIYQGAKITMPDSYVVGSASAPISVTGSYAAGGLFGIVFGDYTIDLNWLNKNVSANVLANGARAGQLVGIVSTVEELTSAQLTITNGTSLVVNIGVPSGTSTAVGGLVGVCEENATISLEADSFTITGTINAGTGIAGGAIGIVRNTSVDLSNITVEISTITGGTSGGIIGCVDNSEAIITEPVVKSTLSYDGTCPGFGGIIGYVTNASRIIIDEPKVTASLNSTGPVGALLGTVDDASAVELQGIIDVASASITGSNTQKGIIAGEQDSSLIYLAGVEGKIDGNYQLDVSDIGLNDVQSGHNGGVYRNQQMSDGKLLIGDGSITNVGKINNTISKVEGKYQLGTSGETDAAADLETFAIANSSDGEFGLVGVFEGASTCADILSASYVLNDNADISYLKTGIVTLTSNRPLVAKTEIDGTITNRPTTEGDAAYAFSGVFAGKDKTITIKQDSERGRWRMGLFSGLANAQISNLIITGDAQVVNWGGGLAFWTTGNSLTLNDIRVEKTVTNITGMYGGVVAKELSGVSPYTITAENIELASKITAAANPDCSGFITDMDNVELNLKTITLGGSIKSSGSGTIGGFLGKTWNQAGGTIDGITVEAGTTFDTNAVFGALIHTASNRAEGSILTMKDVNLANLAVTMYTQANCSLCIYNGQNLVLEMIDYSTAGAAVTGATTDFDEIMAYNVIDVYQKTFGVVSLHKTGSLFQDYHYKNQATYSGTAPTINANSRYYYDVFQHIESSSVDTKVSTDVIITKEGDYYVIDSAAKYLLWDVVQCCDDVASLRNTFNPYFTTTNDDGSTAVNMPSNWGKSYYFRGDIDLTNYSVYPVPRQGDCEYIGQDATITYAAAGMEDWEIPNDEKSQHYMLHSGLLFSTYNGKITIDDFTFKGSIACNAPSNTGVLVAGNLNGDGEFTDITLDGLYISSYGEDSAKNGASLLIGNITASTESTAAVKTVTFDGIEMTGYTENAGWIAASLIYYAGNKNGTNLVLNFHDMALEDNKRSADKYGTVFKYSTFLYEYYYTDDASINKGSGLYLFTEADEAGGRVTYGAELDSDTEYYDTTNKVLAADNEILIKELGTVPTDASTVWIPYVYIQDTTSTEKQIEVNPKSGDILKGCGTYEDPYIIESYKQFLTLYRYINEPEKEDGEEYQYQSFYEGWKVIKTGTDTDADFCSAKHSVTLAEGDVADTVEKRVYELYDGETLKVSYTFVGEGAQEARVFGETDFPTPDELSQAYYQLGADINLSGITNVTYKQIAEDFVGFGTLERPFTGVWYGQDPLDSTAIHTVTLADKKDGARYTTYGFIQYAKGCVVKDIKLTSTHSSAETVDLTTMANVRDVNDTHNDISCSGGSVIACILGGDNIIDGVTTSVYLRTYADAAVGGLVGRVQKGGLILRNITEESVKNYRVYIANGDWGGSYCGSIVGKVEDGYILYEGNSDSYIFDPTVAILYRDNTLLNVEPVINYDILNASKLQNTGITVSKTTVDTSTVNINVTIPNAAALQVMSMAMNADALNICESTYQELKEEYNQHWGYSNSSRSRKADYSHIGNCLVTDTDYLSAAKYDNIMGYINADGSYTAEKAYGYPYLYKYMGITDSAYLDYMSGNYSILNPGETIDGVTYHITWKLSSGTYDMSVFEDGFRGIGALYRPIDGTDGKKATAVGGTFRGDFTGTLDSNGNVATNIILDMNRVPQWAEVQLFASSRRVGLFNVLNAPKVVAANHQGIYNGFAEFGITDGAQTRSCYTIQNFNIGGSVTATGDQEAYAAGVVGEIVTGNFVFDNIGTVEDNPLTIFSRKTDGTVNDEMQGIFDFGGIAGKITNQQSYVLIQNCHWSGTEDNPIELDGQDHGGGFVGQTAALYLKIKDCSMEYLNLVSKGQNAGGMLGYANNQAGQVIITGTMSSDGDTTVNTPVSVKNSSISAFFQAGGIVGESRIKFLASNLYSENNTVSSRKNMGGVIGELCTFYATKEQTSLISDVTVKDIVIEEDINASESDITGIGGVIGKNTHILTLENVKVSGTKNADAYNCQIVANSSKARKKGIAVGGVIGSQGRNAYVSPTDAVVNCPLTLIDCEVADVYIEGGAVPSSSANPIVAAGGIIGYVGIDYDNIVLGGVIKTSGLTVKVPLQSEATALSYLAAGGCFGIIQNAVKADSSSVLSYVENISATNNTVTGKYAGGLVGRLVGANSEIRFQASKVTDGTVYADEAAGGLIGYVQSGNNGSAFNASGSVSDDEKNLVSGMTITGRAAGGAFGYVNISYMRVRAENVTIQDSQIIAEGSETTSCSAGGLVGEINFNAARSLVLYNSSLNDNTIVCETSEEGNITALSNYSAGGILGRTVKDTSDVAGELLCDNITIGTGNKIGMRRTGETEVKLLKASDGTLSSETTMPDVSSLQTETDLDTGATIAPKNYDALDSLVKEYGYCVGTIIGSMDSVAAQVYLMRSDDTAEEFTIPVMENNPPVTDVGIHALAQITEDNTTYYRKGAHIIYGASVSERTETNEDNVSISYMASDAFKNVAYMNARVEEVSAEYVNDAKVEDAVELAALLKNYRLSKDAAELFQNTYAETYTFPGYTNTVGPILVYRPENGTLQEVLECMADVMTNVAGASASDIDSARLTIEATQKLVTGDVVSDGANASITNGDTPSISVAFADGQWNYTLEHEDGLVESAMSYTELTYTYTYGDGHQKIFKLPIYVEEPIYYGVHTMIMEGSVTSVDEIKQKGLLGTSEGTSVVIANDSAYTLLMEYSYGEAREKMPDQVITEKTFRLESASGQKVLAEGTRLRLIDVTHGNVPYYYTVTGTDVTEVRFSDFKDSSGNSYYANQPICDLVSEGEEVTDAAGNMYYSYTDLAGHSLENAGVERYLLTVFNNDTTEMAYSIHTDLIPQIKEAGQEKPREATDAEKAQFMPLEGHEELPWFAVDAVFGLTITLKDGKDSDGNEYTSITGKISKDDTVTVKATYVLEASAQYWNLKANSASLDSENNGKYLELAFYLRDGSRISLPEGTNVSYVTEYDANGDPIYSENTVIEDGAILYYYKDILGVENPISDLLQAGKNVEKTVEFKLNFSNADLTELNSSKYEAWIELLRTADSQYPMGSGNMLDYYNTEISAQAANNLGFAIQATDLNQLAINTYPAAEETNVISYQTMFDFSDILEKISGDGKDQVLKKWAGFDYEVTYTLYQKQVQQQTSESGVTTDVISYVKYTGDDIAVSVTDATESTENTYENDGFTGLTAIYNFTEDEIDGELIVKDGTLTISTSELVVDQANLTNYKIIATLKIRESENASTDEEAATEDFFVFTVTKLKTDLSE